MQLRGADLYRAIHRELQKKSWIPIVAVIREFVPESRVRSVAAGYARWKKQHAVNTSDPFVNITPGENVNKLEEEESPYSSIEDQNDDIFSGGSSDPSNVNTSDPFVNITPGENVNKLEEVTLTQLIEMVESLAVQDPMGPHHRYLERVMGERQRDRRIVLDTINYINMLMRERSVTI